MFAYKGPYQDTYQHCYDIWSERFIQFFIKFPIHPITLNGWSWDILSSNHHITWKTIQNHPELPWNLTTATANENITWKIIQSNPDKLWDLRYFCSNVNITEDVVEKLENREIVGLDYDPLHDESFYDKISRSRHISYDFIMKRLHCHWNWWALAKWLPLHLPEVQSDPYYMSQNKSITIDDVLHSQHPISKFDWMTLSCHPNMNLDVIQSHTDLPWDVAYVSWNPNLTWEFIQKNCQSNMFHWGFLTENPCITWDIITSNPTLPWDVDRFSWNPNLTLAIVENNFDKFFTQSSEMLESCHEYLPFDIERNEFIKRKQSTYYILFYCHYLMTARKTQKKTPHSLVFECSDLIQAVSYYI